MVVIAVWGMETLKNLDTISVPLLLLIMIVGTVMAFRIYGTAGLSANEVETPTMSMIEGIGTAFSFFSASAFTAADLTRFQRNRRDTVKLGADAGGDHHLCDRGVALARGGRV